MDGEVMMDTQILDMRNTIGYIIEKMNLRDKINTLIELSHSGASQKEDSRDSMESRKPTLNII